MIFINGMGCTETGAKQVLTWFLESYPFEEHVVAIAPFRIESKSDRRITALLLSHQIFGRWLRVPLELIIGLAGFLRFFSLIINLSNYGLCFNRNYVLYIHSPSLLPAKKKKGWKDGGSNPLKQWMLKSCLRRCGLVVVQTQHMRDDLEGYLHRESITPAAVRVLLPPFPKGVQVKRSVGKKFPIQLFYPCSRFLHKRSELAIHAVEEVHRQGFADIGLVVTSASIRGDERCCLDIGRVDHEEVMARFKTSDALLFTSERETLGLPLLEALSFEIPAILPDLPYARAIYGEAGIYFSRFSTEDVADAIVRATGQLEELREKVRRRKELLRAEMVDWKEQWAVMRDVISSRKP